MVPLIENLASEFSHASAPQRILLTVTSGEKFEGLAKRYIHRGLKRNIPSLFADLKPLYKDEFKRDLIHKIVEEYRAKLESNEHVKSDGMRATVPLPQKLTCLSDDNSPTTLVWTLYFLAQHHSALEKYQEADEVLKIAIDHTPTLPELYMARARNLKRAGDYFGATVAMDSAHELDGQDRFLNTKCATYHLRAGEIDEAQRLFGMFTKKDASSPAKDLEDMQSFKFLMEDGEAHLRNERLALALKRFRAVNRVSTFLLSRGNNA
jgi:peptide alpha-N-acetyltransferase